MWWWGLWLFLCRGLRSLENLTLRKSKMSKGTERRGTDTSAGEIPSLPTVHPPCLWSDSLPAAALCTGVGTVQTVALCGQFVPVGNWEEIEKLKGERGLSPSCVSSSRQGHPHSGHSLWAQHLVPAAAGDLRFHVVFYSPCTNLTGSF